MFRLFTVVIVIITFIYATEEFDELNNTHKICPPVDCKGKYKTCPYGYQKIDGCEICRCYDPCNPPGKPMICGANRRCFIDTTPHGTFFARCGSIRLENDKSVCRLQKATGRCKGLFQRFYYNITTGHCEQFIYGGCYGNGNNFRSKDECEAICKN